MPLSGGRKKMIKIGKKYEFIAIVKEYDSEWVSVSGEIYALGETEARTEMTHQGYMDVVLREKK